MIHKPLKNKIDPRTFGGTQAAINLADVVNKLDSQRVLEKVKTFLDHHLQKSRDIIGSNLQNKVHIFNLLVKDSVAKIQRSNLPPLAKTHLANVIVADYRSWLHNTIPTKKLLSMDLQKQGYSRYVADKEAFNYLNNGD